MQFIIFYFSGTGNTEIISEEIKKRLEIKNHNVELISIEDTVKIENVSLKNKIIGFGFPVYKFSYPDIFNNVLPIINRLGQNNKYFQFSTYARFTAESFYEFSKQLEKNTFNLITEESFKSPSCGISARKPESDFEYESVMFFEDDIHIKLDAFVDRILSSIHTNSVKITHKHTVFSKAKLKLVKDIERTKYPKMQIDKNVCSGCGLCARKCPDQNLVMMENHIKIHDEYTCLHCLRCMNHCPANAIIFGKLTVGENRYTLQLRNQLFKKAVSGYKEKYWKIFEEIRTQWRKNTLKYWWKHRKRPEI